MMKFGKYVLISAALLSGAACLTACSSDDTVSDVVNPNLSPDGKAVKTEFAINIPRAKNARMSAENTQNNSNNFLGMNDVMLIPIHKDNVKEKKFSSTINLANIGGSDLGTGIKGGTKTYDNVTVPVGTTKFLFYAHAPQTKEGSSDAEKMFKSGVLTTNLGTVSNAKAVEFALLNAKVEEQADAKQSEHILKALNAIVGVKNFNDNQNLKSLYTNFCALKAGSAASVLATVEALYNAINPWTQHKDEATKTVATAVIAAITGDAGAFEVTNQATGINPATLGWKQFKSADVTYPRNLNLPDGAAILDFDENGTHQFSYKTSGLSIGGTPSIDVNTISFPASLYYWVYSDAKATSDVTATFPAYDDWSNMIQGWGNEVTATTQKIAIADKINYGVASLQLQVKCNGLTLPEHKFDHQTTASKINVPVGGYEVTGVLIGGQPNKVGYDFGQLTDSEFNTTVYDNDVNIKAPANNLGDANYTLVLPNYNSTATSKEQKTVAFALELTNNGDDFHGAGGQLVPHGATFYLVGQLQPTDDEAKSKYVFEKDTQATAKVTISSLANAYNTIPDLRATNLSFGLAVDLDWTVGLNFDVTIQ